MTVLLQQILTRLGSIVYSVEFRLHNNLIRIYDDGNLIDRIEQENENVVIYLDGTNIVAVNYDDNLYKLCNGIKETVLHHTNTASLYIGHGKYTEFDYIDVIAVCQHNWTLNKNGYAHTSIKRKKIKLHKFIAERMDLIGYIDHKDRNSLNNKRRNLRLATNNQNNANSKRSPNATGYTGVYKNHDAYVALISIDDRLYHLGRYKDLVKAFEKYKKEHVRIYGEFSPYYKK